MFGQIKNLKIDMTMLKGKIKWQTTVINGLSDRLDALSNHQRECEEENTSYRREKVADEVRIMEYREQVAQYQREVDLYVKKEKHKPLCDYYPDAERVAGALADAINMGEVLSVLDYDSGLFVVKDRSAGFARNQAMEIVEKDTDKEYMITVHRTK